MMRLLVIAAGLAMTTACSSVMEHHVEYTTVAPDEYPQLTAVGYAPVDKQRGATEDERVLQAMRASRLEALRELVEQVQGVRLQGETRVQDMMLQSDQFRSEVSGVIRGAEVVRSYPVGDYYATELKLDFERVQQLYVSTARPTRVQKITYY